MPQNWKTYKLGDFGSFKNGANFSRKDFGKGHPVINVKNLFRGRFATINDLPSIVPGTVKNIEENRVLKNDLLFARSSLVASGTGQVAIVNELPHPDTLFSGFIIRYRIERTNQLDPHFLNYYLRGPKARRYFESIGTGTTITNLTQSTLADVEVDLPPLPEQRAIASILSSLDDKIELNLQMNKTLEEMAMTLYKHWFVDFGPFKEGEFIDSELGPIPEGWEVKKLGDVIDTLGGGTPKTTVDEYWENGTIDWYSPTDLTKANSLYSLGTAKKITELGLKKSSSKLFPKGSLLMSSRATIGAITINRKEACTNQGFITMIPNEKVSLYQLHGWTVTNMDLIISKANGSTFKEISKSNFRDLLITVGVELDEYLRSVESIYSQIENNILENQTLTNLRDTLLPKLISGAVRVKDIESQVAEVL